MSSTISPSAASTRIELLIGLSEAIERKKGRTAAFGALSIQDHDRILASLEISRFDWTVIENQGLKDRLKMIMRTITKELRITASISPKSRLYRLTTLVKTIAQQKDPTHAFDSLHQDDRDRIQTSLELSQFNWSTIKKRKLRERFISTIRMMAKELREKTVDKMPIDPLSLILHMTGEHPARIAPVCKAFDRTQKIAYQAFLESYRKDRRMAAFTRSLTSESIKQMDPVAQIQRAKAIHHSVLISIKELGIEEALKKTDPHYLLPLHIAPIRAQVQAIEDRDLIEIFIRVKLYLNYILPNNNTTYPDLTIKTSHANKAETIRRWMKLRPLLLATVLELDLSELNLRTLPPELELLTSLKKLDLYGNQLFALPKTLFNLKQLIELNLSNNQLREISSQIEQLTELKLLHFSGNQIKKLPTELGNLGRLTHLCISGNKLKTLPSSLFRLSCLTEFAFANNPLPFQPVFIGCFLNAMALKKVPPNLQTEHLKDLRKLFSIQAKSKKNLMIQDHLRILASTIKDTMFQRLFEETSMQISAVVLFRSQQSTNIDEIIGDLNDLPQSLRHRVYEFTAILENQPGSKTKHIEFGRRVFMKKVEPLPTLSTFIKATQLVLLETVFVHLGKTLQRKEFSAEIQKYFDRIDPRFRSRLGAHLEVVERDAGRWQNIPNLGELAFAKREQLDAPETSRILSVERLLEELTTQKMMA